MKTIFKFYKTGKTVSLLSVYAGETEPAKEHYNVETEGGVTFTVEAEKGYDLFFDELWISIVRAAAREKYPDVFRDASKISAVVDYFRAHRQGKTVPEPFPGAEVIAVALMAKYVTSRPAYSEFEQQPDKMAFLAKFSHA